MPDIFDTLEETAKTDIFDEVAEPAPVPAPYKSPFEMAPGTVTPGMSPEQASATRFYEGWAAGVPQQQFTPWTDVPMLNVTPEMLESAEKVAIPGAAAIAPFLPESVKKFRRGGEEELAQTITGLTTPESVVQLPMYAVPYLGEVMMAKQGAEAIGTGLGNITEAIAQRDPSLAGRGAVQFGAGAGMAIPGVSGPFNRLRPARPPSIPTPEVPDASSIEKAAEIHGNVQPQPVEGAREVPAEVSGEGVQPQAPTEGIPPPGEVLKPPTPPGEIPPPGDVLNAKRVKEQLISKAQEALKAAPETLNEAPEGTPSKVEIAVPGDGTFTVLNMKAQIQQTLDAFKRIDTSKGVPFGGKPKPIPKPTSTAKLGSITPQSAAKTIQKFTSDDPARAILANTFSDGKQLVATDGRRMIVIEGDYGGTAEKPLVKHAQTGAVETAGEFPKWQQVMEPISRTYKKVADITASELHRVATQAHQLFKGEDKTAKVRLFLDKDGNLSATAETGAPGDQVTIGKPEEANAIGTYQTIYLIDAANAARELGTERMEIGRADQTGNVVDDPGALVLKGKGWTQVVMKMAEEAKEVIPLEKAKEEGPEVLSHTDLPPPAEGTVRLYHGEGGAEGGGTGGGWFSTDPQRAASYGPNVTYVDVPADVAKAAQEAARKNPSAATQDHVLPDEWVKKAEPTNVEQKVYDLEAESAETGPNPPIGERLPAFKEGTAHRAEPPAEFKETLDKYGVNYGGSMDFGGTILHRGELVDKFGESKAGAGISWKGDTTPEKLAEEINRVRSTFLEGVKKAEATKTAADVEPPTATSDWPSGIHETQMSKEPHGLPPGVPDRGPQFAQELMETSRRLNSLVRSKLNLRKGVLGMWQRTIEGDKIFTRDIRNQRTVAHEIGHALDAQIFENGALGVSQQSLVERLGGGDKKVLNRELTDISELMRGPVIGSYRKQARELIADFFALYAHDPDRARAMAPQFSKGFEAAVAKHPDAGPAVAQLMKGNVQPVAPAAKAGSQIGKATPLAGKVPARPLAAAAPREAEAAVATENMVKGSVRTLAAEEQSARVLGDKWRRDVPKGTERNDVGAFIEGIGNLEIPGDNIEAVRGRMTQAMQRLAKEYRFRIELLRQRINHYLKDMEPGEYLAFLEDYLGHFYADGAKKIQSALGRFIKESPHAKERTIPTLKEAVDLGLTPLTQDPATTYELGARINWRVATNRRFVGEMKNLKGLSGEPMVVPAKDAPPGWPITNNPLIQRVYARKTPEATLLWKGGAAIHPDVWRAARQILDTPTSSDLGKAYDAINSTTRASAFALTFFHDLTLRTAALGSMARWYNPMRGLVRIMERNPLTGEREVIRSTRSLGKEMQQSEQAVTHAAQRGLKFAWTDSEAYQKNARHFLEKAAALTRGIPYLGKLTRIARDLQQMRHEGLWKNTHDAYKIVAFHDIASKALQQAPKGADAVKIEEQVGSLLNDVYGGQEWQTKFWLEPKARQAMSRFLLAPDWTLSTIRSVPGVSDVAAMAREHAPRIAGRERLPTQREGAAGNLSRVRFWGGEMAALAMATLAAQYAIYTALGKKDQGDKPWVWDNELNARTRVDVTPIMRAMPGHDPNDKTRHYVNLGKRPEEILRYFTDLPKQIESKASRPAAEVFKQITGMEGDFKLPWKMDHEAFLESVPERARSLAKEFLPFSFTGNQFVLSLPMRKGMTKYKAQQAFESVFEVAADPSRIRSMLRGQPASEGSLRDMTSQITDAAQRNGVMTEPIRTRALSVVRGHHYDLFLKATQKGDFSAMDKEAQALLRLQSPNLVESLGRSAQQKGMALTPDQWSQAGKAIQSATPKVYPPRPALDLQPVP